MTAFYYEEIAHGKFKLQRCTDGSGELLLWIDLPGGEQDVNAFHKFITNMVNSGVIHEATVYSSRSFVGPFRVPKTYDKDQN